MEESSKSSEAGSKIVRAVTFNVQRWVDVKGKDNIARVIETLAALQPDIVGMQEVMYPHAMSENAKGILKPHRGKPAIQAVADELGMEYVYGREIWDERRSEYYGNALLSKIPFATTPTRHNAKGIAGLIIADLDLTRLIQDQSTEEKGRKEKEKKSEKEHKEKKEETGSSLRVLRVGVTHLDPADEELRVRQVRAAYKLLNTKNPIEREIYWKPRRRDPNYEREVALLAKIKKNEKKHPPKETSVSSVPHLLLGDLNAMRQSDYTPEHWKHLIEFSEKRQWTPPQSLAMHELDKLGYKDTFHLVGEGEMLTAWTDNTIFRIDYLLASSDFPFAFVKCKRDNSTASDHYPVLLDFNVSLRS